MLSTLLEKLEQALEKNKNAANVPWMEGYMKNRFVFFGIKKPTLNLIFLSFKEEIKALPNHLFWELTETLWEKPQREYHYFVLEALKTHKKQLEKEDIKKLEWLITNHSWWDTVDMLATHMVASYFKKFPNQKNSIVTSWLKSENMWLIRTCIIFQIKYKNTTDTELLFRLCAQYKSSNEFFIQKAIGWALRAYGDVEPQPVLQFVKNTPLKPLSKREAIRKIK